MGRSTSTSGTMAFRWENGVMSSIGDLPGGTVGSSATGISADGSVIVGNASSSSGGGAFRWENGAMIGLGDLPDGTFKSEAKSVSGDGSIIVGNGITETAVGGLVQEAFIWDSLNGMRSIVDVLSYEYGLGATLAGWRLFDANDISFDGLTIAGSGINPLGAVEGWMVTLDPTPPSTIPEPSTILLLGSGLCFITLRKKQARKNK